MSSASSSPPETVLCCSCRQKCYHTSQWSCGWRWPTLVPDRCLYHTDTCICPDSKSFVSLGEQLSPDFFFFLNSIHFGFSQFYREIPEMCKSMPRLFPYLESYNAPVYSEAALLHSCHHHCHPPAQTGTPLQDLTPRYCGGVLAMQSSSSETLAARVLSRFLRSCRLPAPSALPVCSRVLARRKVMGWKFP